MSEDAYMSLASDHVALVEEHRELLAERDRLRAVVEHDVLPWLRYVTDDARDLGDHERADATAALYRSIVEQLDRSADMGAGSGSDGE